MPSKKESLEKEICELETRLADLKARLPAHSIPPTMMAEMDDLEDRLFQAKTRLHQERHQEQD